MNTEQHDHKGRPTNPWPNLPPSRKGLGCFDLAANHCRSMHTFNLDPHFPTPRLGQIELGRAEEFVSRSLERRWIFQSRAPGLGHADDRARLRDEIAA